MRLAHDLVSIEDLWRSGQVPRMACPVCGDDHVHTDATFAVDGDIEPGWPGCGSVVVIPCWSECGSKWQLCLGFHEGKTYVFERISQYCPPDDPEMREEWHSRHEVGP